jgi:valyl-tRNA synthetase
MVAPYPQPDENLINPEAEREIELEMANVTAIRNLRAEMNVPPASKVSVTFATSNDWSQMVIKHYSLATAILAKVEAQDINPDSGPPAMSAKAVVGDVEIFMPLTGVIDFGEEVRRLEKEMEKLSKDLTQAQRKLANEDFRQKAPPEVVAKEEEKVEVWKEKLSKLQTHRERIKELTGGEK